MQKKNEKQLQSTYFEEKITKHKTYATQEKEIGKINYRFCVRSFASKAIIGVEYCTPPFILGTIFSKRPAL